MRGQASTSKLQDARTDVSVKGAFHFGHDVKCF